MEEVVEPREITLYVETPSGETLEVPFRGPELIIGRSRDAGLTVADRFLSRQHTRIFRRGDELCVEDLGSRNGTFLNQELVTGALPVREGDLVRICETSIRIGRRQADDLAQTPSQGLEAVFRDADELLPRGQAARPIAHDASSLARHADRLHLLTEVHEALSRSETPEHLLELILDRIFHHLQPQEAVVYLDSPDGELYSAASRRGPEVQSEILFSSSLAHEVVDKRQAALVFDARTDQRFATADSVMEAGVKSLVAAPLLLTDRTLGMIVLSSRLAVRQFNEEDLEVLTALASVAALRLHNLELAVAAAERRQLQRELELARQIQVALLPDHLPQVPGYQMHAVNIPSRGVSGDFYTVVPRSDGVELVILLADVSGKGMAASLLTASVEALAADPIEVGHPPAEICHRVSRRLFARTRAEKYATAFVTTLIPATGGLRYCNAGHNPPLVVRRDRIDRLGATGVPIGLLEDATYEDGEVALEPGDLLVIYTDGITEANDASGGEFGIDRLAAICRRVRERSLPDVVDQIGRELERHVGVGPFEDDRTLVLLRRD